MNVALCSAFRNSTGYLGGYLRQVQRLGVDLGYRGDCLRCIWAEGDSTDETLDHLARCAPHYNAELVKVDHGGADYGSVVHPQRFANLAKVCNEVWRRLPADADAVIWAESDLIWDAATMIALLDRLADYPAIGPMVILKREGYPPGYYYDNWATRKDGKRIGTTPPYFAGWDMKEPLQVDSTGSVLVMRGDIARRLSWPEEDVIVGLCRQLYQVGGSVWLDPTRKVVHL